MTQEVVRCHAILQTLSMPEEVTRLLSAASGGDGAAANKLASLVYDELHGRAAALMKRESRADSMQATMLVNEAFMRLVDAAKVDWESRNHFFALASRVMRQVLVEHARARSRLKRGGNVTRVQLDEALTISASKDDDVLALDEALQLLAERDPVQAEIVTLRFFGGLSVQAVADALGLSKRRVEREWTLIKAWLRREMTG